MDISMQSTSDVSARLTVKVSPDDYKDRVRENLKKIGRTHQIPGFRKGHVSIADLERRFGKEVTADVINDVVYEAVSKFIQEQKLEVLGQPLPVEVKEIDFKNGNDFTFEYDLALAPKIDFIPDKNLTIPYYNIEVSDEMVNERDQALCRRFGAQVPGEVTEPDALVKGSLMELNADGTVREDADAIQVIAGIVGPKFFTSPEEAAKFADKKVGDKVVFNPYNSCNGNVTELASMLQIPKEVAGNVHADFEMAISEIIVVRPAEHGQELYDEVFGADKVHSEEEYTNELRRMIAGQLSGNSEQLFMYDARKAILEAVGAVQLPDELLKRWLVSRNEGLNEQNIDAEYDRMRDDLIWQLVSDRIAQQLNVTVTDADLLEFAKGLAVQQFAQYGMNNMDMETITNFAQRMLQDKEWGGRIRGDVANARLFAAIKDAVTIDNKSLTLDGFREMVKDL